MAYKDYPAASKSGVELIGQVTPAGHPNLMKDVAIRIDETREFQVTYDNTAL